MPFLKNNFLMALLPNGIVHLLLRIIFPFLQFSVACRCRSLWSIKSWAFGCSVPQCANCMPVLHWHFFMNFIQILIPSHCLFSSREFWQNPLGIDHHRNVIWSFCRRLPFWEASAALPTHCHLHTDWFATKQFIVAVKFAKTENFNFFIPSRNGHLRTCRSLPVALQFWGTRSDFVPKGRDFSKFSTFNC